MYEYNFGDIVYLKTDPEQKPRMVVRIILTPEVNYFVLACGTEESTHHVMEISPDRIIM